MTYIVYTFIGMFEGYGEQSAATWDDAIKQVRTYLDGQAAYRPVIADALDTVFANWKAGKIDHIWLKDYEVGAYVTSARITGPVAPVK